jgi:(E)-4-hydroxy-3-methylbut-2-enyl-diphosphate synthase
MKSDEELIIKRRVTRKVKVGNIFIGGDAPIAVQTMAKTKTDDVDATIAQIHAVQQAGADLVRVAVPDEKAARSLEWIRLNIQIPLVADIHFNAKFAMIALEQGVDKLRLNPATSATKPKSATSCAPPKSAACRFASASMRAASTLTSKSVTD